MNLSFTLYVNLVLILSIVSIWSLIFQCRINLIPSVIPLDRKSDVSNGVIKNNSPYHIDCQLYGLVKLKINFEKIQIFCSNPQVIIVLSCLPIKLNQGFFLLFRFLCVFAHLGLLGLVWKWLWFWFYQKFCNDPQ